MTYSFYTRLFHILEAACGHIKLLARSRVVPKSKETKPKLKQICLCLILMMRVPRDRWSPCGWRSKRRLMQQTITRGPRCCIRLDLNWANELSRSFPPHRHACLIYNMVPTDGPVPLYIYIRPHRGVTFAMLKKVSSGLLYIWRQKLCTLQ